VILLANVKWGKQSYDVVVDTTQPVSSFKQQLYELTGVAPDKQKSTLSSITLLSVGFLLSP
jgi:hypothetical protein